jgi:hypothetical protein
MSEAEHDKLESLGKEIQKGLDYLEGWAKAMAEIK